MILLLYRILLLNQSAPLLMFMILLPDQIGSYCYFSVDMLFNAISYQMVLYSRYTGVNTSQLI